VIDGLERFAEWRAQQTAVTQAAGAYNAGKVFTFANSDSVQQVNWSTAGDDQVCEDCQDRADDGPYALQDVDDSELHPNCFPAGTLTSGPRVVGSMSRRYSGWLVDFDFASGNHLSVTPNHPVLTPQGWVIAGLLEEGDEVVRERVAERKLGSDPREDESPALIEDVAAAVGEPIGVSTSSVPVSAHDFHGDGAGSQICVVRADRLLERRGDTSRSEHGGEVARDRTDEELAFLSGSGSPREHLGRVGSAALSFVGGLSDPLPLLRAALGSDKEVRFAHVAPRDAVRKQEVSYRVAVDAILLGDRVFGHPAEVVSGHQFAIERSAVGAQFDASLYEPPPREPLTRTEAPCDGADGLGLRIERDEITGVRWSSFEGHVYNLETVEGWYAANGIIVHNCRCEIDPVEGEDIAGDPTDDDDEGDG
jgi:hypothetical protein